jgi:putative ABC transport system permease protein
VLVSGHCPTKPGEALLSARSFVPNSDAQVWLGREAWKVGTKLRVGGFGNPDFVAYGLGGRSTVGVTIVGLYRPRNTDDPFWFGNTFFDQHPGNLNPEGPPHLDTLFVTRATMLSIGDPSYVTVDFDFPLTPTAVRLNNEDAERALVANILHRQNIHTPLAATSGLGVVLKAADSERDLVDIGTLLVILQLGLLAWLVLFQVVADAVEARGNEIAMAKLRGHSARATIRFGLSEPLVLLAAAIPLGLVAAWGLTHAFAGSLLARDTPAGNPGSGRVRLALVAEVDECLEAARRIVSYVKANS